MKAKDLRERTPEDLRDLEKSLAKDVFTARFKNFTNRLDDTSTINKTRRDLARVKTLIRQAEINAASVSGKGEGGEPAAAKPQKKAAPKKKAAAAKAASAAPKKKSTKKAEAKS